MSEAVRSGSRWYDAMPDEADVKEWFTGQPLHAGMEHGAYFGGIVIIPATEKSKVTKTKANGERYTVDQERSVFTPYVKVDARVAYFWDYVRTLNGGEAHGDYVGVIGPVLQRNIDKPDDPYRNDYLPDGFSIVAVREGGSAGGVARFYVCTMEVAIYHRPADESSATAVLRGIDSKQTAILKRSGYADEFAVMKARTGAVGRALGVAGILTVGTGVASAEDIQEMQGGAQAGVTPAESASLPPDAVEEPLPPVELLAPIADETMRERASRLEVKLQADFPDRHEAFSQWWQARKLPPLATLTGAALRGVCIKLERELLDAGRGQ